MASARAEKVLAYPNFLMKWDAMAKKNPYNPKSNPKGVINLGMAENRLCEDIMNEKLSKCLSKQVDVSTHYYFCNYGNLSFRETIGQLLTNHFHTADDIDPENLIVVNGTTAIFDILSFALAENGDYFLCPAPYYSRIRNNLADKGGVLCYDVPIEQSTNKQQKNDALLIDKLKGAYFDARSKGLKIKGIVLINPNNPTGRGFSQKELTDILYFCNRYDLHVICDEIYALSVYGGTKFYSILGLKNVPNPEKIHFIWGFSKDFGLSGYRCGVLHTQDKKILEFSRKVSFYHNLPAQIQILLERMISDKVWISKTFLPTYRKRLVEAYNVTVARLMKIGVSVFKGTGGIFIWANFSKYMKEKTFEEEELLFKKLFEGGVYCCPGKEFYCSEPGWFRIIFTTYKTNMEEALTRLENILKSLKKKENPDINCNFVSYKAKAWWSSQVRDSKGNIPGDNYVFSTHL